VDKVLLTGRLTRDPELRALASGSSVATFAVATNEYRGNGKERAEYQYSGRFPGTRSDAIKPSCRSEAGNLATRS
jgi:hypothetical protein